MNKIKFLTFITALGLSSSAYAMKPITIEDQGSFMAGGKTITAPGKYDGSKPTDFAGETLHGDHAYVFYQKPVNAKKNCLVFLHGYGQSGKSWETTPDGRDGFQNIFLEKGFPTYIVDQPRRGRAGQSSVPHQLSAMPDDQLWYNTFRIGEWPNVYDNVQVPRDEESLRQFFHQMTPDTGAFDQEVISDAMAAVFEKAGEGVIVTHSAGGGPGWHTALKTNNVKGIISIEPGAFPFPEGEVPEVEKTSSPFPAVGEPMKMDDFMKLTKIPIVVYFGDNIPSEPTDNFGKDNWRVRLNLARKWEKVMKKYGGDVSIVYLPDIGVKGNTHFLMADLNNDKVADVMEKWLIDKGLASETLPTPEKIQTETIKRKDFGAKAIITPLPVLIIATYDENGTPNAMNAAWGGQVGRNQIAFHLSPHKTTDNIKLKKAFTVSFANKENVVMADYFGVETGRNLNKVEKAGAHAIKSKFVDAPIIDEFPLTLECKVVEMDMTPYNELRVVGEVVNMTAKESILDEKGNVDLGKLQPISYDSSSHFYRVLGEPVGKAFSDGLQIKNK